MVVIVVLLLDCWIGDRGIGQFVGLFRTIVITILRPKIGLFVVKVGVMQLDLNNRISKNVLDN